jgi:hypothetical protein
MGISGGPYIIRDSSLVLDFDANDKNCYVSGSTKCYDLNGSGPASFYNGASWDNTAGGAFTFSSASGQQYIATDNSIPLSPIDGVTVEQWLYFPNSYGTMLSMYYRTGTTIIDVTQGSFETGFPAVKSFYTYAFNTGSWYHGIWTHSTSTNNARHYINGVTIYNQSPGTLTIPSTTTNFYIANNYSAPTRFDGKIAITRLYNKVLSPSEAIQNYNAQKSRFGLK